MNTFLNNTLEWMAGILGSLVVVYMTQIIKIHVFVPKKELSEIIRKLYFVTEYYANIITNPGTVNELKSNEANSELRRAAIDLSAYLTEQPRCKYKQLSYEDLEDISRRALFLSNSVYHKNAEEENSRQLEMIRSALKEGSMTNRKNNDL